MTAGTVLLNEIKNHDSYNLNKLNCCQELL